MPDRGNKPDFLFDVPSLGEPGALTVFSFEGDEAVSQLYRFEIKLISKDGAVPFADVVGKPAVLAMKRAVGEPVQVQGLIAEFWQGGMHDDDYHTYHAVVVPRVWALGRSHQSRVFQNMTVPDIIAKVLKDAGFTTSDYKLTLQATYPPREYCVQYQETDLDFVRRLAEFEGIFFFFEEGEHGEVLAFADARNAAPPIAGEAEVTYNTTGGMAAHDVETVRDLVYREHVVTGRVALSDYNYRTPTVALHAEAVANADMPGRYYDYGEHYKTLAEGNRLARVRAEEIECARRVMTGVSDCMRLRAGATFSLDRPFRADLALDYFLVGVRHRGAQGSSVTNSGGSDDGVHYANEFRCLPAAVTFRPARTTPVPRMYGLMTAKIEKAGGDYAYLDDQGRYRVRMPFDLAPAGGEGQRSRAIRMAQPYAGAGYGIHFPNHAGAEMVWACIDGDIDRPLALGTVPNPGQGAPTTSANKTENLIRTWAGNQILLDDTKEKTRVAISSKDQNSISLNDADDNVVIQTTKGHTLTFDDKNERVVAKTTKGHTLLFDDKNQAVVAKTEAGHEIHIDDKNKTILLSDKAKDNQITINFGANTITIRSENGSIALVAKKGEVSIDAKTVSITSSDKTTMKAKDTAIEAQMKFDVQATDAAITAKVKLSQKGTQIESTADGTHKTKGAMVSSEGSAMNELKGGIVNVQGALVKIN